MSERSAAQWAVHRFDLEGRNSEVASQPPAQGWQPPADGHGYGPPVHPNRSNAFAIVALVFGIAACCFGLIPILQFFAFPLAVVGLVLGVVGIARARKGFRTGKTMAIVATVLCVLGLVLAVIGVSIMSKALNDRDPSPGAAIGNEEIHAKDLDVQFGKFVNDKNPSLESGKLVVTLTNRGNSSASFKVRLEAVDAAGKHIDDDTAYAPHLAPGQSTTTYMFVLLMSNKLDDMQQATFRVVEVSKY